MVSLCRAVVPDFVLNMFGVNRSEPLAQSDRSLFIGNEGYIVVPKNPLVRGAVKIVPTYPRSFLGLSDAFHIEAQKCINMITKVWEDEGVFDYIVFGKETTGSTFEWEVAPYAKSGMKFWKQLKVLWAITFGGTTIKTSEQIRRVTDIQERLTAFARPIERLSGNGVECRVFCNQEIVQRQTVFEGREVNVIYGNAPVVIGRGGDHILVVPKRPVERFSDLTESEHTEAMQLSQRLVRFYREEKGCSTAYVHHKTGKESGQTFPHFVLQLIFTATKTQDIFGKLRVLRNMAFGASRISLRELDRRVIQLREQLHDVLSPAYTQRSY